MEKWLFRLVLFIAVLVSGSLYPIIFGAVIPTTLIVFLVFVLSIIKASFCAKTLRVFVLNGIIILLVLFLHFFLNGSNNYENEFLKFIFRVIAALSVLFGYSLYRRDMLVDFIWVMKLFLFHAILNFFFGFIFIENLEVVDTDQIEVLTFKYLFFYISEASSVNFHFFRNQGVFWEPGVLSVFLNLLLFVYLFLRQNGKMALIVLAVIITTYSTTGMILSFFLFMIKYSRRLLNGFSALLIMIIAIGVFLPLIIENVDDKLNGKGEASFYLRTYDMLISYQLVSENILDGIGFGGSTYKKIQEESSVFLGSELSEGRGNTNSVVYIFIAFGVPLAIYILYLLYNQKIFSYQNKYLFLLVLLTCLSTEPLITSVFFLSVVFSHLFSMDNNDVLI